MAFVTGFFGATVSRPSLAGCKLSRRAVRAAGPRMKAEAATTKEMSASVPFFERPPMLDGSLPGDVGFDPLGFSSMFDLNFLRESEVKHGRVCMLAIVGWFFPEVVYHLPNEMYSAVNPLDAPGKVGWAPILQIVLFIAVIEALTWKKLYEENVGALGLAKSPEARKRMQLAEIKNGRLAMCAIGGAIHHALLTHQGMFEQIYAGNWWNGAYKPF